MADPIKLAELTIGMGYMHIKRQGVAPILSKERVIPYNKITDIDFIFYDTYCTVVVSLGNEYVFSLPFSVPSAQALRDDYQYFIMHCTRNETMNTSSRVMSPGGTMLLKQMDGPIKNDSSEDHVAASRF